MERWNNVKASLSVNICVEDGFVFDDDTGEELPELAQFDPEPCDELVIEFESSGYYDPGSMYGGHDHLGWPPEGSDERTFVTAHLGDKQLPADLGKSLFEKYEQQIEKVELE